MGYIQTESAKQSAIVTKLIAALADHKRDVQQLETARTLWMAFIKRGEIGTPASIKASNGFTAALGLEVDAHKKVRALEKEYEEQSEKMMKYVEDKATFQDLKTKNPKLYKQRKKEYIAYLEGLYK